MENEHRRILSSKLALTTNCVLVLSNVALLLVLHYDRDFKIDESVSKTLRKETSILLLQYVLLPMAAITLLSNCLYRKSRSGENVSNDETSRLGLDAGVYWYEMVRDDISDTFNSMARFVGMVALLCACMSLTLLGIRTIYEDQPANTTRTNRFSPGLPTTSTPYIPF